MWPFQQPSAVTASHEAIAEPVQLPEKLRNSQTMHLGDPRRAPQARNAGRRKIRCLRPLYPIQIVLGDEHVAYSEGRRRIENQADPELERTRRAGEEGLPKSRSVGSYPRIVGAVMSTLSVRLPNSLHQQIRELAKREGISINQFISTAAAEKLSALMTEEYLEKRPSRAKFEDTLSRLPDVEPEEYDRL
jgi:hypothetical protein